MTDGRNADHDREELILGDLQGLLALPPLGPARPDTMPEPLPAYCRWIDKLQGVIPSKTVEPEISAQPPADPDRPRADFGLTSTGAAQP